MKIVVLAAGYGTRLYPLTLDTPKALLKVGGKAILERIMENAFSIKDADRAVIVSNDKFYKGFSEWVGGVKGKPFMNGKAIEVLNDGTTSNETRLGAIGDIAFAIDRMKFDDDLLIMGSDNLFEFNLQDFTDFARSKEKHAALAFYDIRDIKLAHLYGIGHVDKDGAVLDFQEKPKEPKSTLAATAIYYYPKEIVPLFKEYTDSGMSKDAPGNFIRWLISKQKVYGFVFTEKWYDIGDLKSFKIADKLYWDMENNRKEG